jgi:dTDP-4-amino-4,6-dideoxygalactose transaminase
MLITRHPHVAEEIVERRHFGQKHERGSGMLTAVPDWVTLGTNCRMPEPLGAIGVEQMKKLHDILDARRSNYKVLSHALADFEQIQSNGYSHYGLSAFIPDRDRVHAEMKRKNVETSIYYRTPVPHTTYYANYHKVGQFPNAEAISGETLCFPVGPHITQKAIAYMVETLRSCL